MEQRGTWGAIPEEWARLKKLAKDDLLPVVSNPHAPKSELSRIKAELNLMPMQAGDVRRHR